MKLQIEMSKELIENGIAKIRGGKTVMYTYDEPIFVHITTAGTSHWINNIIRENLSNGIDLNCYCCTPVRYENTGIPKVAKVETYNDRVVKVTFVDNTFTKSVCSPNDRFDIDVGITICLMKRWLGKDGNKLYNNMIRDIHKTMEHNEKAKEKAAEEKRERIRKQRKEELKKAAKKAKERQEQIDIQKTAMVEAMRVINTQTGDDMK